MHVNIRGGITNFDKWRTIVELCSLKKPDVLVITETGHNNHPSTLRWLTRTMKPNELNNLDDRSKLSDQFKDTLPYNMYSTEGISTPGERGGVAVLVHTSLAHRVLGQPVTPPPQTLDDFNPRNPRRTHQDRCNLHEAITSVPPRSPCRVERTHGLRCQPRYPPTHSSPHRRFQCLYEQPT